MHGISTLEFVQRSSGSLAVRLQALRDQLITWSDEEHNGSDRASVFW